MQSLPFVRGKVTLYEKFMQEFGDWYIAEPCLMKDLSWRNHIKEFFDLQDTRGLTLHEAVKPIREALCDCNAYHCEAEIYSNWCDLCRKPLHS